MNFKTSVLLLVFLHFYHSRNSNSS